MTEAPNGYESPSRLSRGGDFGQEEQPPARDAPAVEDAGPGVRYFPPGDVPEEAGGPYGGAPYGYDEGPRYAAPYDRDGPRFADRGDADGWGRPGPGRYGPPGYTHDYGAGSDDGPPPRPHRRRARAVIARLCAAGEIDPRTCAVTRRALRRQEGE